MVPLENMPSDAGGIDAEDDDNGDVKRRLERCLSMSFHTTDTISSVTGMSSPRSDAAFWNCAKDGGWKVNLDGLRKRGTVGGSGSLLPGYLERLYTSRRH